MTRGADEYFLPTIKDCAKVLNINLLESEGRESVLYSSKGLGEPPLLNGMSVYFSIKVKASNSKHLQNDDNESFKINQEAVRAARSDAGLTGKFDLKLPTTPGQSHNYCQHQHLVIKILSKIHDHMSSLYVLYSYRKCAGGLPQQPCPPLQLKSIFHPVHDWISYRIHIKRISIHHCLLHCHMHPRF